MYAIDSSGQRVTDTNAFGKGGLEIYAGLGVANTFTRGITIDGSADEVQLTVEAVAGQTAEIIQWQQSGTVYLGSISAIGQTSVFVRDSLTDTAIAVLTLGHNTDGTAAAGFGAGINLYLESSTTEDQSAAAIEWLWLTATHATRAADLVFSAYYTSTKQEGLRIRGATGGVELGFFGVTPAARPAAYTPTNVTTDRAFNADSTTLAEIADVLGTVIADLQTLGLLS